MKWIQLLLSLLVLNYCFCEERLKPDFNAYLFNVDNDAFVGSDDFYTNGIYFGYISDLKTSLSNGGLSIIKTGLQHLPGLRIEDGHSYGILSFNHRMYTPGDIKQESLIEDDMPYSGQFLVHGSLVTQNFDRMGAWTFTVGLTGPLTGAEELQSKSHQLIGVAEPAGWDHQLDNEILVNIFYEERRRLKRFGGDAYSGDVVGTAGGALGNLASYLDLGLALRVGYNVPYNFRTKPLFMGEAGIGIVDNRIHDDRTHAYLIVSANMTALGNVIIWEGNTFKDSHSIPYDHMLLRASLGAVYGSDPISIQINTSWTTIPWDNPDGKTTDIFTRFTLSYVF